MLNGGNFFCKFNVIGHNTQIEHSENEFGSGYCRKINLDGLAGWLAARRT
jgi:hypothetical protein